ncbi:MAG TPA: substrate-binding domain-containing protein [Opitutales bacterium]|nr:substrate-binding domain-containing protein [Opitutales bacterium]
MKKPLFKLLSPADQIAEYLRSAIRSGRYAGNMPGIVTLAKKLRVHRSVVEKALHLLEREGLLISQGAGKARTIQASAEPLISEVRISIILYERDDSMNRIISELKHQLLSAGRELIFAPKTLVDLNHDPKRVAQMVEANPADLWIVQAASKPVLEWFVEASIPALALFGRMEDLPIAAVGPDKVPAVREAVQHLVEFGHQRIVFLVREERRKPQIGTTEQAFIDELEAHGIKTGAYNLPDWEDSPEGFHRCLEELFQMTPPTAFLVGDWLLFLALQNYLGWVSQKKSENIDIICTDHNPALKWCHPPVAHVYWDHVATARQAVRWVEKAVTGNVQTKQNMTRAKFIPGGSWHQKLNKKLAAQLKTG